ncbi:TetR/AcrR family transcriptional regulator [Cryobacterium tagatosivorans]|uniref:TetR/AcrR family transcriptional regulator n=1 Tax=Cryobacterium tagatosivorans TaxID=1259199 RepID=A0A4R8UCB8_9MICO|nr:TetR/AcrR family transcriptional regulator [Cryobacterium tagatosivorans]TFB49002.1 TetR/AcrR family transcriptional regulator [Cryobacterium tagatosivorans]
MGRIQAFDTVAVVQAARDLFWDKGYEATSLADLEAATGLARSSLYHAFGSKRGLFDAAVADYLDTVIRPRLQVLLTGATDASALLAYLDGLRLAVQRRPDASGASDDADGSDGPDGSRGSNNSGDSRGSPTRGCLLINCAAGLAAHDDPAREVVDGYRAELVAALKHALLSAGAGQPFQPTLVDERARTLASFTMSAMLLARVNPDESAALLETASGLVRSWMPEVGSTA